MQQTEACTCPHVEIITDLATEDLLDLQPGERLWKLFCFREAGHATGLRHRIYTKHKTDGRLALVTFAAHNPPVVVHDTTNGAPAESAPVRSAIARVADLSVADLDRLITAMRRQMVSDACEELDLSGSASLDEQLRYLRTLAAES